MKSIEPWEAAMTYIDVPFLHRGRSRQGVDCAGLLICVARDVGYPKIQDLTIYGREPQNDGLYDYLKKNVPDGAKPKDASIEINDVLLMRHKPGLPPNHLAIVVPHPDGLGIVHSYGAVGRVVYHGLNERRLSSVVEVFAWPAKD